MADLVTIPDFDFSGTYYPEILRALIQLQRINVPEITDESDEEPYTQLLRSYALVGHLNNVLLDVTATETLLPTARLLESVRGHLALIDVRLEQAKPASTDVILEFSKVFLISTLIAPEDNQFATVETDESPQIIFENNDSFTIDPTNEPTSIFTFSAGKIKILDNAFDGGDFVTIEGVDFVEGVEWSAGVTIALSLDSLATAINTSVDDAINGRIKAIVGNDNTISVIPIIQDVESIVITESDGATDNFEVASGTFGPDRKGLASTDGLFFDLFPSKPKVGDLVYFAHKDIMWDALEWVFNTPGSGFELSFEFFDGNLEDAKPNSVINLGSNLEMDVTDLLGTNDRTGAAIRVVLSSSGSSEIVVSQFVGGKNIITTTGLLGQTAVSTDEQDYVVGTFWGEVSDTVDATVGLTIDEKVSYTLPQSLSQNWTKTTINGVDGHWSRMRVISFSETAAVLTGTNLNLLGLDTSNFNVKIQIDAFASTEIDITADLGVSGSYVIGDLVTNINAALSAVHISLASVASDVGGQLRLTSPTANQSSKVELTAPSGTDATLEAFGLSESDFPHTQNGIGGNPNVDRIRIDTGNQFLLVPVVQGQTVAEEPLGSSNGAPDQEFILTQRPLIEGTLLIEVNEGSGFQPWDSKENFLNSSSASKHYVLEIQADDTAIVTFGDGTRGKIPVPGVDNIRAIYRIGADIDGNVGANTITINKSGISFVNRIFNPRQALGFAVKEGSTDEDLARLKIEGPATLRTRGRGITIPDIEFLATQFETSVGSKIVSRALGIEETFGVKTIELIVVGQAGILLTEAQREELTDFFNGNKIKNIDPVLLANHEVTVVNYTPQIIDVTATVTGGNEEQIKNALVSLLNPDAVFDDGITKRWAFGQEIPFSVIIAEIFEVDPVNIKKVVLTVPATDTQLGTRELPLPGTISISVI